MNICRFYLSAILTVLITQTGLSQLKIRESAIIEYYASTYSIENNCEIITKMAGIGSQMQFAAIYGTSADCNNPSYISWLYEIYNSSNYIKDSLYRIISPISVNRFTYNDELSFVQNYNTDLRFSVYLLTSFFGKDTFSHRQIISEEKLAELFYRSIILTSTNRLSNWEQGLVQKYQTESNYLKKDSILLEHVIISRGLDIAYGTFRPNSEFFDVIDQDFRSLKRIAENNFIIPSPPENMFYLHEAPGFGRWLDKNDWPLLVSEISDAYCRAGANKTCKQRFTITAPIGWSACKIEYSIRSRRGTNEFSFTQNGFHDSPSGSKRFQGYDVYLYSKGCFCYPKQTGANIAFSTIKLFAVPDGASDEEYDACGCEPILKTKNSTIRTPYNKTTFQNLRKPE